MKQQSQGMYLYIPTVVGRVDKCDLGLVRQLLAPSVYDTYSSSCESTLLGLQPPLGDKPVKFQVVCPHNGTAVLKGSSWKVTWYVR